MGRELVLFILISSLVSLASDLVYGQVNQSQEDALLFDLRPTMEPFLIRADVFCPDSDCDTIQPADKYQVLGFDLGDGLFYDLNGYLCFDILALLSVDVEGNFVVQRTDESRLFKQVYYFYKRGEKFYKGHNPNSKINIARFAIDYEVDRVNVKESFLSKYSVQFSPDGDVIKQNGGFNKTIRRIGDQEYEISGLFKKNIVKRDDIIEVDNHQFKKVSSTEMEFFRTGFLSKLSQIYHIAKYEDGFAVHKGKRLILEVFCFPGEVIVVDQYGRRLSYRLLEN
ncbi:hypothetical protein [Membranihabitans marinus]|uniref:hypothetical protein n=1 Tax=Membranihabitans marinus TaxID=1227546 RepID=UPI001F2CA8B7|nr:hypothetical protein [Membranihabitans marinus]